MKIDDLRDEILSLPKIFVILVTSSIKSYLAVILELLKILLNEMKKSGIYVTTNRPYASFCDILMERGIDTENLYFVDCISHLAGIPVKKTEKCHFLTGPTVLSDISISIEEFLEEIRKPCFLFLDSISTLLIYNEATKVAALSHILSGKIRVSGLMGVIVSLKEEMEMGILRTITQFCDKVLEVE